MQNNNIEIEQIVAQAIKLAVSRRHSYVLTEHVVLALIEHLPFRKTLVGFGTNVDMLELELSAYLDSLASLVMPEGTNQQPKKTNALERCFNRAMTQVLFTGRRSMNTGDLYLAIMAENNSHAQYFLLKYGVKKVEFYEFWQQNYKHGDVTLTNTQADEILTEFCTNLTKMAVEDRLEPMIGRSKELDEMITILARKFKANVLMVGDPGVGKCLTYDTEITVRVPDDIYLILNDLNN